MLTDEDIIHHFASRLVYAIESGATRAAIDIYREWRVHITTTGQRHDQSVALQACMHKLLRQTCDGRSGDRAPISRSHVLATAGR